MTVLLEKNLDVLRESLPSLGVAESEINIPERLSQLLHVEVWGEEEFSFLGKLLRKVDIAGRLKTSYRRDWTRASGSEDLEEPWQSLAALLVYRAYCKGWGQESTRFDTAICMNALAKLLDMVSAPWISEGSPVRAEIDDEIEKCLLNGCPRSFVPDGEMEARAISFQNHSRHQEISVTILFYEGPIARAYLETLYACGLKPARIINLVVSRDLISDRPAGRALPGFIRIPYLTYRQQRQIHYWPRQISRQFSKLHQTISEEVEDKFGFSHEILKAATRLHDLSRYSARVEPILVDGLRDRSLKDRLRAIAPGTVLFTGGGIVPGEVIAIPGLRLLHVHPGYLPQLRGADCTLWSNLLADRSSASCFFMASDIDMGAVVDRCWLPEVRFPLDTSEYDIRTLYRAIYAFLDPWIRAYCLHRVLNSFQSLSEIEAYEQNKVDGRTFHFMHDRFKFAAFRSLFHTDRDA